MPNQSLFVTHIIIHLQCVEKCYTVMAIELNCLQLTDMTLTMTTCEQLA